MSDIDRPDRRRRYQFRLRTLMTLVLVTAVGIWGYLEFRIGAYRREWQIDQRALAELRAAGGYYGLGTSTVGPGWLRRMAGPARAKYFRRVSAVLYVATDYRPASKVARKYNRQWTLIQE